MLFTTLRISPALTSASRSPLRSSLRASACATAPTYAARRLAHSGYGDGDGDPAGETPQKQGASPSADLEHPGPPPVSEGQGSGSTPTKGTSEGHNTSPSSSESKGKVGGGEARSGGARPTIHDERGGPRSSSGSSKEDVEQHNREFEKRRGGKHGVDDGSEKAGKGMFKGMGGTGEK
ncbi:MAG: hypothetical protein M1816_003576 [Peltula sp. TS41687]|nr:MAG: hypothetical protein M1816_003576 [Peltula sp. TS41687]